LEPNQSFFYEKIVLHRFTIFFNCLQWGDKNPPKTTEGPAGISYSIINTNPHDTSSFYRSLLFYKGDMYESTGLEGKSKLLKVDFENRGKPLEALTWIVKFWRRNCYH